MTAAKGETSARVPFLSVEPWKSVMTRKAARRCEGSRRSKRSRAADRNWETIQLSYFNLQLLLEYWLLGS